jgi:alkylation response protein AidB-like acyl-CoA dehydrogenase
MGFTISPDFSPTIARLIERRTPIAQSRLGGSELPTTWKNLNDDVGLAGLYVREDHGGQGATLVELGAAAYEAGRVGWSSPMVAAAGVAARLLRSIDPEDATGLQEELASGERVVVTALHEDERGTDLAFTTRTSGTPGDTTVDGSKLFVDSGTHADTILAPAVTREGEAVVVVVAVNQAGVEVTTMPAIDEGRGLAAVRFTAATGKVVATDADIPAALDDAYLVGALLAAADLIGSAGQCLDLSIEYSMTRHQFGRAIATFQSIKHKLVDMFAELETARSAVASALNSAAEADADWRFAASAAKVRASDAAMYVAREAVQVHGGIGFTYEHDLSHHFRRITTLRALYGTPTEHRARVSTALGF